MGFTSVKLYCLKINDEVVCEVTSDVPAWLPVRPRLDRGWLRGLVAQVLRDYFRSRKAVVKA
jgi:hypothetical protein